MEEKRPVRGICAGRVREARRMSINPNRDISVLWVAESNWLPDSGIKPHEHDYYHMFMVRQGPLDFIVDDVEYRLNKGEGILAQPGAIHGLNNATAQMGRVYEIKFITSNPGLRSLLAGIPAVLPAAPFAEIVVEELVTESGRQEPSSPTFATDYLLSLIDFYSRHYGRQRTMDTSTIDITGYSKVSAEIVRYLEDHFASEVPLQKLADAVGFNKNYICSVFKRDSGMTIGNCQTAIRIRKAAEMISFSDLNLAQVASAVGFTNLSHFNRIFKKVVGIPPGQYRRMFTADILVGGGDDDALRKIVGENGFIVSVLGRKRMSISEIIAFAKQDGDENSDSD